MQGRNTYNTLVFSILFVLGVSLFSNFNLFAQTSRLTLIKNISDYRDHVLSTNATGAQKLSTVLSKFDLLNYQPPQVFYFNQQLRTYLIAFSRGDSWLINRTGENIRTNHMAQLLTREDIGVLLNNIEMFDLWELGFLHYDYPYRLNNKSPLFKELMFYNFKDSLTVGEVGAGSGQFSFLLQNLYPLQLISINELDSNLVHYIRQKKLLQDKYADMSKVQVVQGTEKEINFEAETYDRIILRKSLHHFEYKDEMMAAIHRALKPTGLLLVTEFKSRSQICTCPLAMTKREIKRLCRKSGFSLKKLKELDLTSFYIFQKEEK